MPINFAPPLVKILATPLVVACVVLYISFAEVGAIPFVAFLTVSVFFHLLGGRGAGSSGVFLLSRGGAISLSCIVLIPRGGASSLFFSLLLYRWGANCGGSFFMNGHNKTFSPSFLQFHFFPPFPFFFSIFPCFPFRRPYP